MEMSVMSKEELEGEGNLTGSDHEQEKSTEGEELVAATSYIPRSQYEQWKREAKARDLSVSTLISNMVQVGLSEIELEERTPEEIVELRRRLQEAQNERNELQRKVRKLEKQDFQIGLGKIKEFIISNPGVTRREITNYILKNPIQFVDSYLEELESSHFTREGEEWFPPEGLGEKP